VSKQTAPTVSWLQTAREDLVSIYDATHEQNRAEMMRTEAAQVEREDSAAPSAQPRHLQFGVAARSGPSADSARTRTA